MLIKAWKMSGLLPCSVGEQRTLLQSSAPLPEAGASPRCQWQSAKHRKHLTDHPAGANSAPTAWPGSPAAWCRICCSSAEILQLSEKPGSKKTPQGREVSLSQWLQICTLVNTATTHCLLHFPLPPASWFPPFFSSFLPDTFCLFCEILEAGTHFLCVYPVPCMEADSLNAITIKGGVEGRI